MKSVKIISISFAILIFIINYDKGYGQTTTDSADEQMEEECTIGVANGSATSDGRPLLWKTRDYSSRPNNEMKYNTANPIKFISVSNAGSSTTPWLGLNEYGFSIINSVASDLSAGSSGPGNGDVMEYALGHCKTIAEFQDYLDATNITGRTTKTNFGVIDSTGAAAIFETGGNNYWRFDASASARGYVIRTNFAMNGGGSSGMERYLRSGKLIFDFYLENQLNYKSILRRQMRDFSDEDSNPVSVPYAGTWVSGRPFGYIYCSLSICRSSSVSAAVIHGVLPDELAGYTTMWTMLGQPASSIAVPYWPVGFTPAEADGVSTSPLCDKSLQIKDELFDYSDNTNYIDSYKLLDGNGNGLWTCTFPAEDLIFQDVDAFIDTTRTKKPLAVAELLSKEYQHATAALATLDDCYHSQILNITSNKVQDQTELYPNPFNDELNISYYLNKSGWLNIELYSLSGIKIMSIKDEYQGTGKYSLKLNSGNFNIPNGIYLLNISIDNKSKSYKIVKISN